MTGQGTISRVAASGPARIILLGLAGLGALIISAVLVVLMALQFGTVRSMIAERAIDALRSAELSVDVGGYDGLWPVSLGLNRVRISDKDGEIAQIGSLDISWSPLALLTGTVHITQLDMQNVRLARLPQGGEDTAPDDGPLLPTLPVNLTVDRITAPEIVLEAPVAGERAVLSLEGSAALTSGQLVLDIVSERTDRDDFRLDADIALTPSDNRADLNLELHDGSAGRPGLIAALTGDAALGQVDVSLSSEGPADDWRASGTASLGGYGGFEGKAAGDWRVGGAVDAKLHLTPGTETGFDTPIDLSGTVVAVDNGYEVHDLTASGDDISFAGNLAVTDFDDAPHIVLEGEGRGLPYPDDLKDVLPEALALKVDATFDRAFEKADVETLAVEAPGQSIRFTGTADLTGATTIGGTLDAQLADAEPWLALADVDAAGPMELHAEIEKLTGDGEMAGTLDAVFRPTRIGDPDLAELVGETLSIEGRFADGGEGRTAIETLDVTLGSGAAHLSVSGEAGGDAADLSYSLEAPEAARLSGLAGVALTGALASQGTLKGPWDALGLDASVMLDGGSVEGTAVSGTAETQLELAEPLSGPIRFEGHIAGAPAKLSAQLEVTDTEIRLTEVDLDGAGLVAKGDIVIDQSSGAVGGSLEGTIRSLGPAGQFAGVALAGRGPFKLGLDPQADGFAGTLTADLADFDVEDALSARRAAIEARYGEASGLTATAKLQGADAVGLHFGEMTMRARGPFDRLALGVEAGSADFGDGTGADGLVVEALLVTPENKLEITRFEGRMAGSDIALRDTAVLSFDNGFAIGPATLGVGPGGITFEVARQGRALEADVTIEDLPARIIAAMVGDQGAARGTLSGNASISASGGSGSGKAHLTFESLGARRESGQILSPLPPLVFDAGWAEGRLDATLRTDAAGADELLIEASLPLVARGGMPTVPDGARVTATATGEAEIGALWALVPVDGHRLEGHLNLDLKLEGPMDNLSVSGDAALEKGVYENYDTGLLLAPLDAKIEAQPPFGAKVTVTARDGNDGRLSGEGTFDMSAKSANRLDVTLDLTSFRVVRRDEGEAIASGTATVSWPRGPKGELQAIEVGGDITIERADAQIPAQLPSDVVTLDVQKVTDSGQPVDPEAEKKPEEESAGLDLDVSIDVPGRAFVRGRGIESEWRGNMDITGSASSLQLNGVFNVVRGTFDFAGKRFNLASGRIDFTGGEEIDPYINVRAVYEGDGFTATFHISGPASHPDFSLTSSPALPQEEIMSRLLFGSSSGQLSALQAVQLAQATASLTGMMGGGAGVLDKLRRSLGVDVLSIGGEGADSAVEVGEYVSDDVYVGVSQGLGPDSGEVSVEVEVTDDVSVESGFGAKGGSTVGVTWERDY